MSRKAMPRDSIAGRDEPWKGPSPMTRSAPDAAIWAMSGVKKSPLLSGMRFRSVGALMVL
jgi:hypothetical protein